LKRKDFIRYLVKHGCFLVRHGKKHDVYQNPFNGKKATIPRHTELKDSLCELIKTQMKIE